MHNLEKMNAKFTSFYLILINLWNISIHSTSHTIKNWELIGGHLLEVIVRSRLLNVADSPYSPADNWLISMNWSMSTPTISYAKAQNVLNIIFVSETIVM